MAFAATLPAYQRFSLPQPQTPPPGFGPPMQSQPMGVAGPFNMPQAEPHEPAPARGTMPGPSPWEGYDGNAVVQGAPETNAPPQDEGIAAHRLELFYSSWLMSKSDELANQLVWDRYYHGTGHWTEKQRAILAQRQQPETYFNETAKKVNSYIGIEQRMRRDPKAYPNTPAHEGDCDAATAALRQVDTEVNGPEQFSEAGRDYFVRGIGAIWQGVEQEGQELVICNRHTPSINFIYDPRSLKWDFSDAKFIGEWAWFDVEDAIELFNNLGRPDSASKMEALANSDSRVRGGGVPGEYLKNRVHWFTKELSRVRLVHLYYKYKGEWRCAYFCGAIKLYDAPSIYRCAKNPNKTVQPFQAASCGIDEKGNRYGVVKDLVPIQDAINQRHSKLLWMLSVRQIIMEKGAVDDPDLARAQAQRPDGLIQVNPRGKGEVERRFQILTLDAQIEGQVKLLDAAMQMMQNYGPNTAILGKGDGTEQASGRALLARQNAGMTEMSPIFDRHRMLKINCYKGNWRLVRQFWTKERWIRVTDDEKGVHFVGLNIPQPNTVDMQGRPVLKNDVARMDIDITIDEGPDVVTMNEELMERFATLGEAALGPLGKIMIQLANVPNKDYLFKLIDQAQAPNPQIEEMNKRMAMLEQMLKAAQVDKAIADTEATRATTIKTMSEAMVTPNLLDAFPLEFGTPSFVEQALGQPLNPNSRAAMGNAFADHGTAMQMISANQAAQAADDDFTRGEQERDSAHERAMEAKAFDVAHRPPPGAGKAGGMGVGAPGPKPAPVGPGRALPPSAAAPGGGAMPQLPGQEPVAGAPGGLPVPAGGSPQAQAFMPRA